MNTVHCAITVITVTVTKVLAMFPSDTSLTLTNIMAAIRTVQDMDILGYILEVPSTKKQELKRSANDEERKKGLVKYFLDTHPIASWERLGGELLCWGESKAVEEVKVHIKPNEGMI